ncbi:SDR family oxidoreductase [Streptomyces sp. NPDC086519]|uniref:SDR family oxidoreductase n=1 Tax=Streptomyces sp. NPDC086519 TaxID=3154863 RepID=UPI0034463547
MATATTQPEHGVLLAAAHETPPRSTASSASPSPPPRPSRPSLRVNTFAPGFIETETLLSRADWRSGRREDMIAKMPMGLVPGPAELAGTALFLAADAAAHMTGVYRNADGGFSMIGA